MPLQETSGNLTTDAYGGGAAVVPTYIEDVFSTWLYTGTGASQTITNGIDLSTKGGLTWFKGRSGTGRNNVLTDSARGINYSFYSDLTNAQISATTRVTSYNTDGFSIGDNATINASGETFVSWTFRKQPKFFDVVTYTGTGANRTIAHALGSVPGSIWVKRTDAAGDWQVYHQSLANTEYLVLNTTAAKATGATRWNSTTPTSSVFSLGTDATVNASGGTYVAYIFAHNASGFGLTGTDNVISCGGFTADGSGNATVSLGYEPQWILTKRTSSATDWQMYDNMRGFTADNVAQQALRPNLSSAESGGYNYATNSTGFSLIAVGAANTFIYIAIRRGPMKVPTDATKVFLPTARTGTGSNTTITTGFVNDSVWSSQRAGGYRGVFDRLRGSNNLLFQNSTGAENATYTDTLTSFANNTGVNVGADATWGGINLSGASEATYSFGRAPSFFDEVCYTGTTPNLTVAHNLQAIPELMIIKQRSDVAGWAVFADLTATTMRFGRLDTTAVVASNTYANQGFLTGQPSSSSFTLIGASGQLANNAGSTYVAYLFATCPGVSKVGSYTGNGTTQTIDCGFGAGGARFVLIKRTDAVGNWYVYDTARGMTTLTDPYLLLNSTAAEAATLGSVTTVSTGFALNSTILAAINVNAGTYIFLAIA
jgi:hypothetical protein